MKNQALSWRRIVRFVVPLLLTLLWLGFIFGNSLQTGEESGSQSKLALAWLTHLLESVGIPLSVSEHFLRKLAHFSEYAILALLYISDLWAFGVIAARHPSPRAVALTFSCVPFCFLCAAFDEFCLQGMTVGRGPQWTDVLIDTAGAFTAALLLTVAVLLVHLLRKKKDASERIQP